MPPLFLVFLHLYRSTSVRVFFWANRLEKLQTLNKVDISIRRLPVRCPGDDVDHISSSHSVWRSPRPSLARFYARSEWFTHTVVLVEQKRQAVNRRHTFLWSIFSVHWKLQPASNRCYSAHRSNLCQAGHFKMPQSTSQQAPRRWWYQSFIPITTAQACNFRNLSVTSSG